MASMSDIRACSKHLLQHLQDLDTILDSLSTTSHGADDVEDVVVQSQAILGAVTNTRSILQAAAGDGPKAVLDPAEARRSLAVVMAELPLEPALQALGEMPELVEKVKAQSSNNAVLRVPLCLAYRHCAEALVPLASAVDPREI
ncbi:hypothetical protein [Nocardioides sp. NPDC127503]|uniref:hypothetical protein n=1 Tax=Nocardioides sp. NPDC127503 TaxID=3154516 RepID=UPI0033280EFE